MGERGMRLPLEEKTRRDEVSTARKNTSLPCTAWRELDFLRSYDAFWKSVRSKWKVEENLIIC
jgi:hypothetical protein